MKLKFVPKRLCPKIVLRPLCFLIFLGFCGFGTLKIWLMTQKTAHQIKLEAHGIHNNSFLEIESAARLLLPLNTSTFNLARSLSSYLNGTELSFDTIQTMVAPTLFLALTTIPHLSQVSYMGLDGLLFSYFNDGDQTLAVYSNTSFASNWYTQPVNRDSGLLYGNAIASSPMASVNSSWFQEVINSTNGYSSLVTGWNKGEGSLFLHTVPMDGTGFISLGFPAKVLIDRFAALDFHGGDFHLATADGQVIIHSKLYNTRMVIYNSTLLLQKLNDNGHPEGSIANHSCVSDNGKPSSFDMKIMGKRYIFHCSTLQIAGVESVYVLAYDNYGLESLVRRNNKLSLMILVLMFIAGVISFGIFIILIAKAAKREMFLCAALIKQMNATEQAERKSMNKTFALAKASHDVRASLLAIIGLVELCHEDANPGTGLAENLGLIRACSKDLLGILNSVMEVSKIEAGKMELVEEEFNLAQLLEEVVYMYYHAGIKKGVDVVLDPGDGSILGSCLVRGDRVKLKQILCNLLSNAIKFTSEGHISVRAAVKKKSFKQDIIASNRNVILKCLSKLFYRNKEGFDDLDALHSVEKNPNLMEFEFEVDDTGKGIPKDKQNSIFEEFVQVKETALGHHEGTGLGLGIVQSMVHLMKGEIAIAEKEPGEKGACFKFNVLLTAVCEREHPETDEEDPRSHNDWPQTGLHQHFASFWSTAAKPEGSHIVLFISGEERRRVLKRYIENNLNIKVTIVKQEKSLHQELRKIKKKMDPSCSIGYAEKPESSFADYLTVSASSNSDTGPHDVALDIKDDNDNVSPHFKKISSKCLSGFTLVVIDATAGSVSELFKMLDNFKRDIPSLLCKVVWLDNSVIRHPHSREHRQYTLSSLCDHIISKPFHGSRLIEVLKLLPECKSPSQRNFPKLKIGTSSQELQYCTDRNPLNKLKSTGTEAGASSSSHCSSLKQVVVQSDGKCSEKPLNGKKFLVVDDDAIVQKVTTTVLGKLGAKFEVCTNGKEAFDHVCKLLSDSRKEGHSKALLYHYIMMDCEMPVMNGLEATRLIRKEEEHYDVHIPIIALTAHAIEEVASKIAGAGMDFYLTKPLQKDKLLDVIKSIDEKMEKTIKRTDIIMFVS